jgi:hypothetical protein
MSPQEAAQKVIEGFDKGVFVRDPAGDGDPAWAIKLFPYLRALAVLSEFAETPATETEGT